MRELLINSKKHLGEISLLSKVYHEARLRCSKTTHNAPIIVYQMGKVGSRSIVDSLNSMKLNRSVYHVHFLNERNIEKAAVMLRELYGNHFNVNRWCLYESRFVIKHILQAGTKALQLISLVREPVARNLSSFFHNIEKFIPRCAELYEAAQIDITDISDCYLRRFHEHSYPLTWFDEEIKQVFGIDVFSGANVSVSEDQRVFIYKRDKVDLLVLRTEDIDDVAQKAVQKFLQVDDFRLKRSNLSSDKGYSRVYRDFTRHVKLPKAYVEAMYESKYVKYFYSPQEIERFRGRWLRG